MRANHTGWSRVRSRTPMKGIGAAARHRGYEDARQGLGFPREYDGWPTFQQKNYERGRQQWALVHRALGGTEKDMLHTKAPRWARNMYLTTAVDRVLGRGALDRVCREIGLTTFNDMTFSAYLRWFAVGKVDA